MGSEYKNAVEQLNAQVMLSGLMGDEVNTFDRILAPIKVVRGLSSNPKILNEASFDNMGVPELKKYLSQCVTAMEAARNNMREWRNAMEAIEPIPLTESKPEIVSEISNLKSTLEKFVSNQPKE